VTKNALRIGVSLALTAVLLAVFLWNVDLTEVLHSLEQTDGLMIVVSVVLALATYWFRAVRWQLILRPVGRVRHSSAVLATAVGYAAMTLFPARMGDLVRPVVLSRRERMPVSSTLASILTERLFDLWTVVLFFLVFVAWPPEMAALDAQASRNLEILSVSGYVVGAGLLFGTLLLLGLFRFQERFVAVVTRPIVWIRPRWEEPAARFLGHFLDGLRVLQRPRDLLVTMVASLVLWYGIFWQVKATLLAFHLDLPLRVSYFLVTLAVIGLAIPTPGGVGGFHKATQIGLTAFFGVGLNQATALAIVYHAICFLPITLIGLLCLPIVGVKLRDVDELATEADTR
jgi:uncharacterized protein (TIRG00374 family)